MFELVRKSATMPTVSETTVVNDNAFLDWEQNKTQALTLDMLSRTHMETDVYGKPLREIQHYDLLNRVLGMATDCGYDVEVYDLFAAQNRDRTQPGVVKLPAVEEKYGENAIEAHILRRVYANIRIKDFDDAETTTNLAVAYHQRGIQIGFGANVIICHNQCMLSPEYSVQSYSNKGTRDGGMSITEMLDRVQRWLINAKTVIANDRERIERMKNTEVTAEQILIIIGLLTATRIKADSSNKLIHENITYPLNGTQINQFTEDMLVAYAKNDRISMWDVYNTATELYKATRMDIPNILPQNRAMVSFLNEQFGF
jgi:hypothetical protein